MRTTSMLILKQHREEKVKFHFEQVKVKSRLSNDYWLVFLVHYQELNKESIQDDPERSSHTIVVKAQCLQQWDAAIVINVKYWLNKRDSS